MNTHSIYKVLLAGLCYEAYICLTSTNIDGAGNLCYINKWKSSAVVNVADDPGGDGVAIFWGIAAPE